MGGPPLLLKFKDFETEDKKKCLPKAHDFPLQTEKPNKKSKKMAEFFLLLTA